MRISDWSSDVCSSDLIVTFITVTVMDETMSAVETAAAIPAVIVPIRRDLHFKLQSERVGDWHNEGPHVSHFFNALSLLFPDGERLFFHAVLQYRGQIVETTQIGRTS